MGYINVFISIGGFESPTELYDYFFRHGCEPSDIKAHQGPDRLWRGVGKVTHSELGRRDSPQDPRGT